MTSKWSTERELTIQLTTCLVTPSLLRQVTAHVQKVAGEYVNFIASHATPKAMTLTEIKAETLKDPILQEVSAHVRYNTWHKTDKSRHADI